VDEHELATLMVGREMQNYFPEKKDTMISERALEVENVSWREKVRDVSFYVCCGEILGIAGLIGAGRTEIAETIYGIHKKERGDIRVNTTPVQIDSPDDAVRHGLVYIPEDRKSKGLVLPMDMIENTTLSSLAAYCHPFIERSQEIESTKGYVEQLNIKVNDITSPVACLSGGNQQKVCFAKSFELAPSVLILDEPTRGIDVNSKREIYAIIQDHTAQHGACVVISSELTELLGLCHRIIVVHEGQINGEFIANKTSEEELIAYATGIKKWQRR
jgi:ribose transport system ATP-binding protein